MGHIERMQIELEELQEKIMKANEFVKKEIEQPKFTDEKQRIALCCQISYMSCYATVLQERIDYDKKKNGGN